MKRIIFILLMAVLALGSCKKETETFELTGEEFAAEKVGRIRIYKVDSFIFNINTDFDTNRTVTFWERHTTKEIQTDSAGNPYFYHQVYWSPNEKDWIPSYSYKTYIDSINYTKVLNNKKTIHLWLPINEFKSWDGNLFNDDKGGQRFRYVENDELMQPDSIFANQVTVRLKKEILPLTESHAHFESYAPDVGMVYKYLYYNNIQRNTQNVLSQAGYHLHYNLISIN